jgi:nicotinamide riboside kinase
MAFVVTLLGAESTGKTTLAHQLAEVLRGEGHDVAVVDEYLREFCEQTSRTPRAHEQAAIAQEQTRRIAAASEQHDLVIADTSALMVAVYSEQVFGDRSLYDEALAAQPSRGLVLLTTLDLPWVEDGHMRDGPHVREPVDTLLRAALARQGVAYAVVSGQGDARLESALRAVRHALTPTDHSEGAARWRWVCERCSDGDCERHLLARG